VHPNPFSSKPRTSPVLRGLEDYRWLKSRDDRAGTDEGIILRALDIHLNEVKSSEVDALCKTRQ